MAVCPTQHLTSREFSTEPEIEKSFIPQMPKNWLLHTSLYVKYLSTYMYRLLGLQRSVTTLLLTITCHHGNRKTAITQLCGRCGKVAIQLGNYFTKD